MDTRFASQTSAQGSILGLSKKSDEMLPKESIVTRKVGFRKSFETSSADFFKARSTTKDTILTKQHSQSIGFIKLDHTKKLLNLISTSC